jgi:hypothetical protein
MSSIKGHHHATNRHIRPSDRVVPFGSSSLGEKQRAVLPNSGDGFEWQDPAWRPDSPARNDGPRGVHSTPHLRSSLLTQGEGAHPQQPNTGHAAVSQSNQRHSGPLREPQRATTPGHQPRPASRPLRNSHVPTPADQRNQKPIGAETHPVQYTGVVRWRTGAKRRNSTSRQLDGPRVAAEP